MKMFLYLLAIVITNVVCMSPSQKAQYAMDAPRTEYFYCCCLCGEPTKMYINETTNDRCSDDFCKVRNNKCVQYLKWSGNTGPGATWQTHRYEIIRRCKYQYMSSTQALMKFDELVAESIRHKNDQQHPTMPLKWMLEPPHD